MMADAAATVGTLELEDLMPSLSPGRSAIRARVMLGGLPTFVVLVTLIGARDASSASATTIRPSRTTLSAFLRDLRQARPAPQPTLADSLAAERALPDSLLLQPLEQYFSRFTTDRRMAQRVSRAVVHYARAHGVAPSLVAAVLVTE